MSDTREEKRAYWASHVKAWQESGETQRSYCHHHQLKPHRLTYWKQVFKPKPETTPMPAANGFLPVHVTSSAPQGLTVRLPSGVSIEGVHTGNLAETQALIEHLT